MRLLNLVTVAILRRYDRHGKLFGPAGNEGVLTTFIALLVSWTTDPLLRSAQAPREPTRPLESGRHAAARAHRGMARAAASSASAETQRSIDSILQRLEALTPQVRGLAPDGPAAVEVRRLIGEELPELVRGYQRVPLALKRQPVHGGRSPDQQLAEGLATMDEQMAACTSAWPRATCTHSPCSSATWRASTSAKNSFFSLPPWGRVGERVALRSAGYEGST